jgi:flagellar biosynthesis/type III secretory pathway protein FliH
LGERDGEALVARLRERASAGERWSAQEQVEAILLPLMGRKRPLPVLLAEVTEVSGVLAVAERAKLLGTMVGLAYNYLEAGLAEQLLEVLRKMNAFEELIADSILKGLTQGRAQGRAEGRVEGRAEGRAERKQEAILEILGKRFGTVPPMLVESLAAVHDPERLTTLLDAALDAESLDAFARAVQAEPSRP